MELETTSHIIQLMVALCGAFILFLMAYLIPEKIVLYFLVLTIPFQIIDSRYGSINMVITYALGIAVLLKGFTNRKSVFKRTPLNLPFFLIMFVYFISTAQAGREYLFDNFLYMINFGANIIIFYLVASLLENEHDFKRMIYILGISCGLVITYCIFQGILGEKRFTFLGIQELTMFATKGAAQIQGPFNAVGITSEFLVINIPLQIYMFANERGKAKKIFWITLLMASCGTLIATGNRGGFLSLVLGLFLIGIMFLRQMGAVRFVAIAMFSGIILIMAGYLVIQYTKYNVLFKRLSSTRLEKGIIPDTRYYAWKNAIEGIKSKPLLGHGPEFKIPEMNLIRRPGLISKWNVETQTETNLQLYPHNLYLFILYTLGFIGLSAYFLFFGKLYFYLHKVSKQIYERNDFISWLINVGKIIIVVFLFDQMKVEFLRSDLTDYQQFAFALFGLLIAVATTFKEKVANGQRAVINRID